MKRMKILRWSLLMCSLLYLAAFVVIHCSSSLRRPAANMLYWYYSDLATLEHFKLIYSRFWLIKPHLPSPLQGRKIFPSCQGGGRGGFKYQ